MSVEMSQLSAIRTATLRVVRLTRYVSGRVIEKYLSNEMSNKLATLALLTV